MKRMIVLFMLCLSLMMQAQENANYKGINWTEGLSWQEVIAKAKEENKYIFVDCYATWCGPCKLMDKNVYPLASVGEKINDRFISVKVQMDTSGSDNEQVKNWYADARSIMQQYEVAAFPTYLFLSPEGQLVQKDMGYKEVNEFIQLAYTAADPAKNFYTFLKNYKKGIKDYSSMFYMITTARNIGYWDSVKTIIRDYKENYLDKLNQDQICTKENLEFINQFVGLGPVRSADNFFRLVYNNPEKADQLMFNGFSNSWVKKVINKEELENKLWKDDKPKTRNPEWNKLYASIDKKYKKVDARRLIADYKIDFYARIRDWRSFANARLEKMKVYPPKPGGGLVGDAWSLNVDAWNAFENCSDKYVLEKALEWIDISMQLDLLESPVVNDQLIDTKANLLYKLGRVKEAIAEEQKAIDILDNIADQNGVARGTYSKGYREIVEKMKKGEPTWPVK